MPKELSEKNYVALNKVMFENMSDNISDLKRSVKHHPFGSRINYYSYLLAMIRLVIDFSGIASAEQNRPLIRSLDQMYQDVHHMLMADSKRFACFNVIEPLNRRTQIGTIYKDSLVVKLALMSKKSDQEFAHVMRQAKGQPISKDAKRSNQTDEASNHKE